MTGQYKSALEDPNDIGWIPVETTGYTEDEAYAFLTANASGAFPSVRQRPPTDDFVPEHRLRKPPAV